jgi:hypothetical protein
MPVFLARCYMNKFISVVVCLAALTPITHGQISFVDEAAQLNIVEYGSSRGVAIIDLNNDTYNEIFITNKFVPNILYVWQDTVYQNMAVQYGINQSFHDHNICIADIDKDCRPDIYIGTDPAFPEMGRYYLNRGYPPFVDMSIPYNLRYVEDMGSSFFQMTRHAPLSAIIGGHLMVWYEGTFVDVTDGSGLESMENVFCPIFFDFDGDYDDDLFIAGNHGSNSGRLFRNNNDGTFTDVSFNTSSGDFPLGQGVTIGDIDNDGDFDMYICAGNLCGSTDLNTMWENNGSGFFTNVTAESNTGVAGYSRGACFGDFDNDGDLDLFVNRAEDYNVLFRNDGTGVFTDISYQSGVADNSNGFGCATGDLNHDGQLDIVVLNGEEAQNQVLINQGNNEAFLRVKLYGLPRNYLALGAIIKLYGISNDQIDTAFLGIREIQSLTTMLSVNEPVAHFATGNYQNLMVDVVFPSWNHVVATDLTPGSTYYISEYNTGIENENAPVPHNYLMLGAYPNPFNGSAKIYANGDPNERIELSIYDISGALVRHEMLMADNSGKIDFTWNGLDNNANSISSGIYIVRAKTDHSQARLKLTYLK